MRAWQTLRGLNVSVFGIWVLLAIRNVVVVDFDHEGLRWNDVHTQHILRLHYLQSYLKHNLSAND